MALDGIYGSHTVETCPVNHRGNAEKLIAFAESDPAPLLSKCGIDRVLGPYHSTFEHTFIWIVDAEEPHALEEFAFEAGLASFNKLKIVPLKDLVEGVLPRIVSCATQAPLQ